MINMRLIFVCLFYFLFSLLPAWLFLFFIFCITKKKGRFPKKRTIYKVFVCALSAALVIPSLYIAGVIILRLSKKQEKTTEESTSVFDDYTLLQYDEDAVYKENENQNLRTLVGCE